MKKQLCHSRRSNRIIMCGVQGDAEVNLRSCEMRSELTLICTERLVDQLYAKAQMMEMSPQLFKSKQAIISKEINEFVSWLLANKYYWTRRDLEWAVDRWSVLVCDIIIK